MVVEKRMKQKVFLPAAVLGNAGLVQQAATPLWKGETKGAHHYARTNAPTAKRPITDKRSAPTVGGYLKGQRSSIHLVKKNTN